MAADRGNPRRQPCFVLHSHGVPNVVWFEDALAKYGVPTVVFDLYLLVPDIDGAARLLEHEGWTTIPQRNGRIGNAIVDLDRHPQWRLAPPIPTQVTSHTASESQTDYEAPVVVLLPAAEWNYTFEEGTPVTFLPSLENMLDALIDSMLDCEREDDLRLQGHLHMQLGYLYDHVPALQDRAFAERLSYEHRQYHLDIRSGMFYGTVPFADHQRRIRKALRLSTWELKECSASHDNELLFNRDVQARLLASLPAPPETMEETEGVE